MDEAVKVRYRPRPLTTAAALLAFGAVGLHISREDALATLVMLCGLAAAAADVAVAILEPKDS